MLRRFHLIPEHYGQMDGQYYINIAHQYADAQAFLCYQFE